jgi:hypothetical protein
MSATLQEACYENTTAVVPGAGAEQQAVESPDR